MHTEPGILGYWFDIYGRWKLVVLTGLFGAASAYVLSLNLPPIYQSTSLFYAPQNIAAPSYLAGSGNLAQTPFVPATEEKAASISLGILRSQDVFRTLANEYPERARSQLQKNVSIEVSREFMIEVVVRDSDPQIAASIANRFPDLLREFQRTQIREHMDAVAAAARSELAAVDERLAKIRSTSANRGGGQAPALAAGVSGSASEAPTGLTAGAADAELRATAERLRTVLGEAMTQSREPPAPVIVVQQASPGERPAFPMPLLNTIVAAITGLALGSYYALFCGYLDRRRHLRTIRNLKAPILGDNEFVILRQAMRSSR